MFTAACYALSAAFFFIAGWPVAGGCMTVAAVAWWLLGDDEG